MVNGRVDLNINVKILVGIASIASIGFGIWHFFVPSMWKWFSYIEASATELIVAIRAINVFFSLSLVLFGALDILFIYHNNANRFSLIALLSATCILWLTRVLLQVIYPQGSLNPDLQNGMLVGFSFVALCYIVSLILIVLEKNVG